MDQVADAVNNARRGRWIRDCEEKARDCIGGVSTVALRDGGADEDRCGGSRFFPLKNETTQRCCVTRGVSRSALQQFCTEGYDATWDSLVEWRRGLRGAKRAEANRLLNYVSERCDMIRYPEVREKNWQTGSGPTEAQCKSTTQR